MLQNILLTHKVKQDQSKTWRCSRSRRPSGTVLWVYVSCIMSGRSKVNRHLWLAAFMLNCLFLSCCSILKKMHHSSILNYERTKSPYKVSLNKLQDLKSGNQHEMGTSDCWQDCGLLQIAHLTVGLGTRWSQGWLQNVHVMSLVW